MDTLNKKAFGSLVVLFLVMAALLFLPAGTIRYWQAWVYLTVFFGASVLITLYLAKNDPALLKRRLSGGPWAEKERAQKIIMVFTSIGFIALIVVPALDFRFGWSAVPLSLVTAGIILVAIGYIIIFFVYKENTYGSATIEVAQDQKVIADRAIFSGAPSDVRGRSPLSYRNAARAWIVVGPRAFRGDAAIPDLADLR